MMNAIVYTAIYGGKNILQDPLYPQSNIDYVCFTDDISLTSNVWNIVQKEKTSEDPVRSAKIFKVNPQNYFSNNSITLWVDGSIRLISNDTYSFINRNLEKGPFVVFPNPERRSVFEEVEYCIQNNKDLPDMLQQQYTKYKNEGFPDNLGLVNCSVLLRDLECEDVLKFNELWWNEILNGSRRDEVSFPYVSWKLGYHYIEFDSYKSRYDCNEIEVSEHLKGYQ